MTVSAHLVPVWLNLAAGLLMFATVAGAVVGAEWRALRVAPERLHVLLGGSTGLGLLWLLTLDVNHAVSIHLLGVTSLTLLVGWRFTILGASLSLLVTLAWQQQSLLAMPLAWLFSVLVPATTTRLLAHALRRYAWPNPFVYMLGAGFGGGLLTVLMLTVVALTTFWLMGRTDWVAQADANRAFLLLLMFPEGFINGMLVTAFTVFYPDLVKTFDDEFYLNG